MGEWKRETETKIGMSAVVGGDEDARMLDIDEDGDVRMLDVEEISL